MSRKIFGRIKIFSAGRNLRQADIVFSFSLSIVLKEESIGFFANTCRRNFFLQDR